LVLYNSGDTDVVFSSFQVNNYDFQVVTTPIGARLKPGDSITIYIKFHSTSYDSTIGILSINGNDYCDQVKVRLVGITNRASGVRMLDSLDNLVMVSYNGFEPIIRSSQEIIRIELWNIEGKMFMSASPFDTQWSTQTLRLPTGCYLARVMLADGSITTIRLIS